MVFVTVHPAGTVLNPEEKRNEIFFRLPSAMPVWFQKSPFTDMSAKLPRYVSYRKSKPYFAGEKECLVELFLNVSPTSCQVLSERSFHAFVGTTSRAGLNDRSPLTFESFARSAQSDLPYEGLAFEPVHT